MAELTQMLPPGAITGGELVPGLQGSSRAGILLAEIGAAPRGAVLFSRVPYLADLSATADADPGAGNLRWNHATPGDATELYVSDVDGDAIDRSDALADIAGGRLYVHRIGIGGIVALQVWRATAASEETGYVKLTVELLYAHGSYSDTDAIQVTAQKPVAGVTDANQINYNNVLSGLDAEDVQDAIDELASRTIEIESGRPLVHDNSASRTFKPDRSGDDPPAIGDAGCFVYMTYAGAKTALFDVANGFDVPLEFWLHNGAASGDITLTFTGITAKWPPGGARALKPGETAIVKFRGEFDCDVIIFGGTATAAPPNVQSVASAVTVTPTFANDAVKITAQAAALTLANPTGTPIDMHGMVIRIKDSGTARAISYGSEYREIGITLPTTTVVGKTTYIAMIYNAEDTKWDCLATGTIA